MRVPKPRLPHLRGDPAFEIVNVLETGKGKVSDRAWRGTTWNAKVGISDFPQRLQGLGGLGRAPRVLCEVWATRNETGVRAKRGCGHSLMRDAKARAGEGWEGGLSGL